MSPRAGPNASLVVQDATLIVEALTRLRATLPFRLRGVDTYYGRVFLNDTVLAFCRTHGIEFARRSRALLDLAEGEVAEFVRVHVRHHPRRGPAVAGERLAFRDRAAADGFHIAPVVRNARGH